MGEVGTLLREAIDECFSAVARGVCISEIERLTTEIDFLVRQQSLCGFEVEVTRDGMRMVRGDGFSRAGWREKGGTSTCEQEGL